MPGPVNSILNTLGAYGSDPERRFGGPATIDVGGGHMMNQWELNRDAQSSAGFAFSEWLRSIGIDDKSLPPELRMQYYQMWLSRNSGKPPHDVSPIQSYTGGGR